MKNNKIRERERILIVNDKQGEFFYGIWDNL